MVDLVAADRRYRYRRLLGRAPVWLVGVLLLPYVWLTTFRMREDAEPMGSGCWFWYGLSWFYFVILAWLAVFNWWPAPRLADAARAVVGRARWFGFAVVTGTLFNVIELATVGRWVAYPTVLIGTLVIWPAWAFCGQLVAREPRTDERKSQWPQISIRVLMIFVAYLGLVMGLWMATAPLGAKARSYEQKSYSYGLIIDSYKMSMAKAPAIREFCERMIGYYTPLVAKYDQARRRPWIEVDPDPPLPGAIAVPASVP